MKFAPQDRYAPLAVRHLRIQGPRTVRELADLIKVDIKSTTKAVHRMMRRGLIEATGEYRGVGKYRSQVYRFVDVEEIEEEDPMMHPRDRNMALEATDLLIRHLRATFTPGLFDPFRVLRAQVAA